MLYYQLIIYNHLLYLSKANKKEHSTLMKNLLYYKLTLLILFFSEGCADEVSKTITPKEDLKKSKSKDILALSLVRFVSAENGLNYRDTPKGKVLGKFPYNSKILVIKKTGIKESILDEGKTVKGEWVGVSLAQDTVYVFNAFLDSYRDSSANIKNTIREIKTDSLYKFDVEVFMNDSSKVANTSLSKIFRINKISKNEFLKRKKENKAPIVLSSITKKADSTLTFVCTNGSKRVFKDTLPEDEFKSEMFHYLGTFKEVKIHLIESMGYECTDYYLLSYETCNLKKLAGYPLFYKNYSKIFTLDTDSYDNTEISVYQFKDGNITREYSFIQPYYANTFNMDSKGSLLVEYMNFWEDKEGTMNKTFQYIEYNFN